MFSRWFWFRFCRVTSRRSGTGSWRQLRASRRRPGPTRPGSQPCPVPETDSRPLAGTGEGPCSAPPPQNRPPQTGSEPARNHTAVIRPGSVLQDELWSSTGLFCPLELVVFGPGSEENTSPGGPNRTRLDGSEHSEPCRGSDLVSGLGPDHLPGLHQLGGGDGGGQNLQQNHNGHITTQSEPGT